MKYHLVAGGDSFVAGVGCERGSLHFVHVWATKHFDNSYTNVGILGATNDTISAAIVTSLKERIINQPVDKPEKKHVVVVGWTGQKRFEISARNKIDLATSVLDRDTTLHKIYRRIPVQNIDRRLLDQLWSASAGYYRFLHAREYLLSFCALHNIKVVEFCTLPIFKATLNKSEVWSRSGRGLTQNQMLVEPLETDKSLVNLLKKGTSLEEFVSNHRSKHDKEMLEQYTAQRLKDGHPTAVESLLIAEMFDHKFNFLYE